MRNRPPIAWPSLILLLACAAAAPPAARAAGRPVPPSPYLGFIYRYADAMLAHGRDVHGPAKTGLLLSVLDRAALAPVAERSIASPAHDQNLLRVLYTLSELSGRPAYRDAADAHLKWLLAADAPVPPWDHAFAWDVLRDAPLPRADAPAMPLRSWMLWDRCFALDAPNAARLVRAMADADAPANAAAGDPRIAGARIRALAAALHHARDDATLRSLEAVLARLEADRQRTAVTSSPARLSAAIDCAGAAGRAGEPLATRLRALAAREDAAFCSLPHDLKGAGGFTVPLDKPRAAVTPLWRSTTPGGLPTTAALAMMCVSRYENGGDLRFRALVHAAADAYRAAGPPPDDADVLPLTFGHAISLHLAAWRSTARQEYLDAATKLADLALQRFWPDGPLPRATPTSAAYATTTGADTLALALVELHLSILHITAVRCPPNTLDR